MVEERIKELFKLIDTRKVKARSLVKAGFQKKKYLPNVVMLYDRLTQEIYCINAKALSDGDIDKVVLASGDFSHSESGEKHQS